MGVKLLCSVYLRPRRVKHILARNFFPEATNLPHFFKWDAKTFLKMPRACPVESHARHYRRRPETLLKMPRACPVESHARHYRRRPETLLKMPRACPVEPHARHYRRRPKHF